MKDVSLDTPLIQFLGPSSVSNWTIREAVEGTAIFGSTGAGKSSGSGFMLASKYLSHDFGGLVLCAKTDEAALWKEYCRVNNRIDDLIVVEERGAHAFNFIEYESTSKNGENIITENLVQVLKTVIQASEEKSSGKTDDPFWENALDMLIFNVVDLCVLAYGKATIQNMYDIVMAAPKAPDEDSEFSSSNHSEQQEKNNAFTKAFELAEKNVKTQIDVWEKSLTGENRTILQADEEAFDKALTEAVADARLLKGVDQFFIDTYRTIGEKTRSLILFSFSGFLFRLLREPIYSLFCQKASTFTPEDCLEGKIILLNFPVKKYHKVGQDIQVMFKYIWQRAMERRDISQNGRPVFLWSDEAQHFLHPYDAEYQATARSSRIATVYISQNLPSYHANMGGMKSDSKVKNLLGNLSTKFFHSNADLETNRYASDLIGQEWMEDPSSSVSIGGTFSSTEGSSYKLNNLFRPEEFAFLKTGGPRNDFKVEGIVHSQSIVFPNGRNFDLVTFDQKYTPNQ